MKKLLITGASGFLGSRIVDFYTGSYEILAPSHHELDITDAQHVSITGLTAWFTVRQSLM